MASASFLWIAPNVSTHLVRTVFQISDLVLRQTLQRVRLCQGLGDQEESGGQLMDCHAQALPLTKETFAGLIQRKKDSRIGLPKR